MGVGERVLADAPRADEPSDLLARPREAGVDEDVAEEVGVGEAKWGDGHPYDVRGERLAHKSVLR